MKQVPILLIVINHLPLDHLLLVFNDDAVRIACGGDAIDAVGSNSGRFGDPAFRCDAGGDAYILRTRGGKHFAEGGVGMQACHES